MVGLVSVTAEAETAIRTNRATNAIIVANFFMVNATPLEYWFVMSVE